MPQDVLVENNAQIDHGADGDGYTNLEEFLNELAGDQDSYGNMINRVGMGNGNVPAPNCGIAI